MRQPLARGTLGSVATDGSAAGDAVAGRVAGDRHIAVGGIMADGQAAEESAVGGSARNQIMFGEGLRGEWQNRGQWLARGTSVSEHDRAGDAQQQRAEQGVAEERELQRRKRKRWRWDMYKPLERQERCSL